MPRSDVKADALATPPRPQGFAPDLAAAFAAAAANFKAHARSVHGTAPGPRQTYQTLIEARQNLARRVPDPYQRAYIILSGSDR